MQDDKGRISMVIYDTTDKITAQMIASFVDSEETPVDIYGSGFSMKVEKTKSFSDKNNNYDKSYSLEIKIISSWE